MQNLSPTTVIEEYEEDGMILTKKQMGDFVVCNLSSIHLGRAVPADVLERLINIQVRMLDNVIDLNEDKIEVKQAVATNRKYRAVGLGTFSYHHLLALNGIKWDSEKAVEFANELYEKIAYYTIKASIELAKQKSPYPMFKNSDWDNGNYFLIRDYVKKNEEGELVNNSEVDWLSVMKDIEQYGIRNGYLQSPAPNGSTAVLANGTPACDPVFNRLYFEEKKNYKIPVTVPDLNPKTTWFYENAYDVDQIASIRQNAARQRHVDQSLSFNIYVRNNIKAKDFLDIHMESWKNKLKTTYYVRSTAVDIFECESCSS